MNREILALTIEADTFTKVNIGDQSTYYVKTKAKYLPADLWMDTNPRKQKTTAKVSKDIKESLLRKGSQFHLLNRGIVISADYVFHFTDKGKEKLRIILSDPAKHGNIDGGHTYKTILENQKFIPEDQLVTLEIITGTEEILLDLVKARNTSNQVKDKSLANYAGAYEFFKDIFEGQPYADYISYVENDNVDAKKTLDITKIINMLLSFDMERYTYEQPNSCFHEHKRMFNRYMNEIKKKDNLMDKLNPIILDIIDLYTYIEKETAELYNKGGGKIGRLGFVTYKQVPYSEDKMRTLENYYTGRFSMEQNITYKLPETVINCMLASLRGCIQENAEGVYEWKEDPKKIFDKTCYAMMQKIQAASRENGSAEALRRSDVWMQCYAVVQKELKKKNKKK